MTAISSHCQNFLFIVTLNSVFQTIYKTDLDPEKLVSKANYVQRISQYQCELLRKHKKIYWFLQFGPGSYFSCL